MKSAIKFAIAVAAEIDTIAGTIKPNGSGVVKICIEDSSLSLWLGRSESIAAEIFGRVGIGTEWLDSSKCPVPSPGPIAIQISTGAPADRFPGALGYARLPENRVEVFFNRISATMEPLRVPTVLGYVLAHETAHVLEGAGRHSDEGLMKARWNSAISNGCSWDNCSSLLRTCNGFGRGRRSF